MDIQIFSAPDGAPPPGARACKIIDFSNPKIVAYLLACRKPTHLRYTMYRHHRRPTIPPKEIDWKTYTTPKTHKPHYVGWPRTQTLNGVELKALRNAQLLERTNAQPVDYVSFGCDILTSKGVEFLKGLPADVFTAGRCFALVYAINYMNFFRAERKKVWVRVRDPKGNVKVEYMGQEPFYRTPLPFETSYMRSRVTKGFRHPIYLAKFAANRITS